MTKTAGFRHASIQDAIELLHNIAEAENWSLTSTEDASNFSSKKLETFDAVIFANTTGDILDEKQQEALEQFIQNGGGFVGIHAAADTEPNWPFYHELLGAHFSDHPPVQTARILVEDSSHPATNSLPNPWQREDEWYNFTANPRSGAHVLLSVDESSYQGGTMGDHPIAWTKEGSQRQRTFYSALGHTPQSYADPAFASHIAGGLRWVLHLE